MPQPLFSAHRQIPGAKLRVRTAWAGAVGRSAHVFAGQPLTCGAVIRDPAVLLLRRADLWAGVAQGDAVIAPGRGALLGAVALAEHRAVPVRGISGLKSRYERSLRLGPSKSYMRHGLHHAAGHCVAELRREHHARSVKSCSTPLFRGFHALDHVYSPVAQPCRPSYFKARDLSSRIAHFRASIGIFGRMIALEEAPWVLAPLPLRTKLTWAPLV